MTKQSWNELRRRVGEKGGFEAEAEFGLDVSSTAFAAILLITLAAMIGGSIWLIVELMFK